MPNIPELLRQLADAIEQNQEDQELRWTSEKKMIEDHITDVDVLAHKNEEKLKRVGMILLED